MPFLATAYRLLIASPGDLPTERDVVSEEIYAWNAAHSMRSKAMLMPVRWETHATPDMSGRPQGIINDQLVSNCDVLIGLFWTRLGTPTGIAESGTAEEIKQFMDSGRRVLLYFSSKPVAMESVDLAQYQRLQDFRKSLRDKGLTGAFGTVEELRRKLTHDLVATMDSLHQVPDAVTLAVAGVRTAPDPLPEDTLSDDAKEMLLEAAGSEHAMVTVMRAMDGIMVNAGGRTFAEFGDRREGARWESAVEELYRLELIKDRGYKHEIFDVTHQGYEVAKTLKAS